MPYCNYYYNYKKKIILKNSDLENSFDEEYKDVLKLQIYFRKNVINHNVQKMIKKKFKNMYKKGEKML